MQVQTLASSATLGKFLTHMCLCHQAVHFGISQWAVMPCSWEGNRRSGVTLATRQTLEVLYLQVQGLGEGDEHPPTLSYGKLYHHLLRALLYYGVPALSLMIPVEQSGL